MYEKVSINMTVAEAKYVKNVLQILDSAAIPTHLKFDEIICIFNQATKKVKIDNDFHDHMEKDAQERAKTVFLSAVQSLTLNGMKKTNTESS